MADTPTDRLKVRKQTLATNRNLWGDTYLNEAFDAFDQAIAGVETVTLTGTASTLSSTNYADNQYRNALLIFAGTPGGDATITHPAVEKIVRALNSLTSGAIYLKTATGTSTGTLPNGRYSEFYIDGSNVVRLTPTLNKMPAPDGNLDMGNYRITGLGTATAPTDAAILANRLDQFGAPTAAVSMGTQRLTALGTGTASDHAVNKAQMDAAIVTAALSASIPAQTGNSGRFLATDGTTASWSTVLAQTAIAVPAPGDSLLAYDKSGAVNGRVTIEKLAGVGALARAARRARYAAATTGI